MAFNTISIEFCAEDRARLDQIVQLLEQIKPLAVQAEEHKAEVVSAPIPPENPFPDPEPVKAETPTQEEPKKEAPKYKLADIQQKVVQLSAGGKKVEVREIVKAYAEKVSAIPEDKFDEVMEKLTGLEG